MQRNAMLNPSVRILSLDGGGIKGVFTASVLATLECETGQRIVDHFDLIVGTSTGGILALGLGLGFSAEDMKNFYLNEGATIFPATSRFARLGGILKRLVGPKLSAAPLKQALDLHLGNRTLAEAKIRLVVTAYDAIEGRIYLFKTPHHEQLVHDRDTLAADVALASSAAPTYFGASKLNRRLGSQFVDGGVWANNPCMVGLTEAVTFLSADLHQISLLSIGTTTSPFSIPEHAQSGALQWNAGLIQLLIEGQCESATSQARLLLGERFHRIDIMTRSGEFALDDARSDKIAQLIELGRGEAVKRANLSKVRESFLNGVRAATFVPS